LEAAGADAAGAAGAAEELDAAVFGLSLLGELEESDAAGAALESPLLSPLEAGGLALP
jgi:hypothetical protein